MKKIYFTLLIAIFIIGCSKDDTINEIQEEQEEEIIVNLPPNNFNIEIVNISHETATIHWDEASDPESDAVNYDIYLNQTLVIENISELMYVFSNLEELTNYSGKIIAKDTRSWLSWQYKHLAIDVVATHTYARIMSSRGYFIY